MKFRAWEVNRRRAKWKATKHSRICEVRLHRLHSTYLPRYLLAVAQAQQYDHYHCMCVHSVTDVSLLTISQSQFLKVVE